MTYLPDETERNIGLRGIHIFGGKPRDQSKDALSRKELTKERKQILSLSERWALVKQELTARFAHEGNAHFVNECRKIEKSRKKNLQKTLRAKVTKQSAEKIK